MVSLQELNAKIEEAKLKKDKESIDAQIEVYEGQAYEAHQSYTEAKASRSKSRSKLPKDIPDDSAYKERLLEAQYIKMKVFTQEQSDQVDTYTAEIKKQQKAKKNIQILDKQIPQLYTSAVQEVEATKSAVTKAKEDVEVKYDAVIKTHKEEIVKKEKRIKEEEKRIEEVIIKEEKRIEELIIKEEKRIEDKSIVFNSVPSGGNWNNFIIGKETVDLGGNKGRRPQQRKEARERAITQHFEQGTLPPALYGDRNRQPNSTYTQMQAQYAVKIKTQNATINLQKAKEEYGFALSRIPPNAGKEVFNAIGDPYNYGINTTDARQINAGSMHNPYVKIGIANINLKQGMYSITEYQKVVGQANLAKAKQDKKESDARSKAYQVESKNQLSADSKKWASVVNNPYTSNPNAQPVTNKSGSGTASDPFRYNTNAGGTGLESKEVDKSKLAYYMQNLQTSSNSLNNNTLENTSFSNKGTDVTNQSLQQIAKQRETELANIQQHQYAQELRAGNIGLADALLNPQTTQSYTGTNTVNLKTFLKERGHDLTKPESIPDSVLMNPQKYDKARKVASESAKLNTTMGDLRFNEPYYAGLSTETGFKDKYPEATVLVQQQREEAKQRIAQFDPIKDSQNMKPVQYEYAVQWGSESVIIPTTTGDGQFTVQAPKTHFFGTVKEAESFANAVGSVSGGGAQATSEDYMFTNYATSVDKGLIPQPRTLVEHGLYHTSGMLGVPVGNIQKTLFNILPEQQKKVVTDEMGFSFQATHVEPTFTEHLFGGTVDDITEGTPFKGTGITSAGAYFMKDPSRTIKQLPIEIVGFKGVEAGIRGVTPVLTRGASTVVSAGTKAGFNIIQSNVPTIIKVPVMAGMGVASNIKSGAVVIGTGITKVASIPKATSDKVVSRVTVASNTALEKVSEKAVKFAINNPSQAVKIPVRIATESAQMLKSNIHKIDLKLNYLDGGRTGLKLKGELLISPVGRALRKETLVQAQKLSYASPEQYAIRHGIINEPKFVKNLRNPNQLTSDITYFDKQTSSIISGTHKKVGGVILDMGHIVKTKPRFKNPERHQQKLDELAKQKSDAMLAWKKEGGLLTTREERIAHAMSNPKGMPSKLKESYIKMKFGGKTKGGVKENQPHQILYTEQASNLAQSHAVLIKTNKLPKGLTGVKQVNPLLHEVPMTKSNRLIIETQISNKKLKPVGQETESILTKRDPIKQDYDATTWNKQDEASMILGQREIDFKNARITMYEGEMLKPVIKENPIKFDKGLLNKPATEAQQIETGINMLPPSNLFASKKPDLILPQPKPKPSSGSTSNQTLMFESKFEPKYVRGTGEVDHIIYSRGTSIAKRNVIPISKPRIIGSVIVSTGTKSLIDQDVSQGIIQQNKISTKLDSGLKTELVQKVNTKNIIKARAKSLVRQKQAIKVSPKVVQIQTQRLNLPFKQTSTFDPPKALPFKLPNQNDQKTTRREKRGKKAGFIGNVRLDNIMGMYKRKEITYGKRKVSKLERQDARLTAKTSNRISTPASGLLKSKKKKKKKTESILGRTVTKTKDEFSGFALSKTKPTKRKKTKKSKPKSKTKRITL
jgi:hypothetical protein